MNSFKLLSSTSKLSFSSLHKVTLPYKYVSSFGSQQRGIRTYVDKLPWNWKNGLLPVFSPKTLDIILNSIVKKNVRLVNEMVQGTDLQTSSLVDLIKITADNSSDATLHSNACSLWNHTFFLHCLIPGGRKPSDNMKALIDLNFQSMEGLLQKFKIQARSLIGNGFIWLVDNNGTLEVIGTPNYSTPLIWDRSTPILGVSIWQHSYFIDHKENVEEYIDAWFRVINWEAVQTHFAHVGPIQEIEEDTKK